MICVSNDDHDIMFYKGLHQINRQPSKRILSFSEMNANILNQRLQVPGSFDRDDSSNVSPRRRNPSANAIPINAILPQDEIVSVTPEELATQRRFSVVNAAMERHNTRRKAKRSQSVMYRSGEQKRASKTYSENT